MAFNSKHLISRYPILDRDRTIAFCRLDMADDAQDVVMPFMLRLTNIDIPQMAYFVPLAWVTDKVLLIKLSREMVLTTEADTLKQEIAEQAQQRGFRLAVALKSSDKYIPRSDFILIPFRDRQLQRSQNAEVDAAILELYIPMDDEPASKKKNQKEDAKIVSLPANHIFTGIETGTDFEQIKEDGAAYFSGNFFMDCPLDTSTKANIHPAHAVILELMTAVQKEADPKVLETIAKKDVTLSFKLLRYVNSPFFGLSSRVESVRHAVSILGYQQMFKWLSLLAVTAGSGTSPALTHAAMTRARLMELLGKNMDKKDQENMFVIGMFSLLDRIMRVPLEQVLKHVNLPETVSDVLLAGKGKYRRYLDLAKACEGFALPEGESYSDIDVKVVNIAHIEAIEWATRILKVGSPSAA